MQIVAEQDQVEVALQAPQRPLPGNMLPTAFLRRAGRRELKRGASKGASSMEGKGSTWEIPGHSALYSSKHPTLTGCHGKSVMQVDFW